MSAPNWLAFALRLRAGFPFSRLALALYLEKRNIQTRPIFTGNVLRQPGFAGIAKDVKGAYPVSDHVMQNGLLVGCHHGLEKRHIDAMKNAFCDFLQKFS